MNIEVVVAEGVTRSACEGRLTGEAAEELYRRSAAALAPERPRLLVDLEAVEYVTSSAIGSIVRLCKDVKDRDGRMAILAPNDRVRIFFEIAGADALVCIARTRDEALRALGGSERA